MSNNTKYQCIGNDGTSVIYKIDAVTGVNSTLDIHFEKNVTVGGLLTASTIGSYGISSSSISTTNLNTQTITLNKLIPEAGMITVGGGLVPDTNIAYDLGTNSKRWRDLYLSGTTIYLGDSQIKAEGTSVVFGSSQSIEVQNIIAKGSAHTLGNVTFNNNTVSAGSINLTNLNVDGITAKSISTGSIYIELMNANVDTILGGNLLPNKQSTFNIGGPENRWNDLYLSGNKIHLGGSQMNSIEKTTRADWVINIGTAITTAGNNCVVVGKQGDVFVSYQQQSTLDTYITKYNTSDTLQWSRRIGGISIYKNTDISVDSENNLYVTGSYFPSLNVYNTNGSTIALSLSSSTQYDGFVLKYDSNGVPKWVSRIGGSDSVNDEGFSITNSLNGSVYVVGYFESMTMTLYKPNGSTSLTVGNTDTVNPTRDAFIAKYNSVGDPVWATKIGGTISGNDIACNIKSGKDGDLYVTGYYNSTQLKIYNANGTLATTIGNSGVYDAFLIKYTSNGVFDWVRRIGGNLYDQSTQIALDLDDYIFVSGFYLSDTLTIYNYDNTTAFTIGNSGQSDAFIAKYDRDGTPLWLTRMAGTLTEYGFSLSTTYNGRVIIAGSYLSDPLNFYNANGVLSYTLGNTGNENIYVSKWDSDGNPMWASRILGSGRDVAYSVSTNLDEQVYVTGIYNSSTLTAYNPNGDLAVSVTNSNPTVSYNAFLIKYSPLYEMGVGGDLLIRGTITTGNINSVGITAGNISASGITVSNLNSNSITSGTLKVGTIDFSGNLLQNGTVFKSSEWTLTGSDLSYTTGTVTVNNLTTGSLVATTVSAGTVQSSNINFTGNLLQNGSPFIGSNWTKTGTNLSYTSGTVTVTNFTTGTLKGTTVSAGTLKADSIDFTGSLTQNGVLFKSGDSTWSQNGTSVFYTTGNVGIGTTNPQYSLDVNGMVYCSDVIASGNFSQASDIRIKKDINTIDEPLNKINSLRGVYYRYIQNDKRSVGVIAQEIEHILPEVVINDNTNIKSVAYGNVVGLLIEGIKELNNIVCELKEEIKQIKQTNESTEMNK